MLKPGDIQVPCEGCGMLLNISAATIAAVGKPRNPRCMKCGKGKRRG